MCGRRKIDLSEDLYLEKKLKKMFLFLDFKGTKFSAVGLLVYFRPRMEYGIYIYVSIMIDSLFLVLPSSESTLNEITE